MKIWHFWLVLLLSLTLLLNPAAASEDTELKKQISSELVGKIVTLRGFYKGRQLNFDADGNLVGRAEPGPWTIYGKMRPVRVSVSDEKVSIEADRLIVHFGKGEMQPEYSDSDKVTLYIKHGGAKDNQQALAAISRMLLIKPEALSDLVPEYWKWFVRKMNGETLDPLPQETPPDGQKIFKVGDNSPGPDGVVRKAVPPKVIYDPDPTYELIARQHKFQGTSVLWLIVDKEGKPASVHVHAPCGFGLDDQAVATIQRWKFNPATLDDQPVAVQIAVEVNFKLYKGKRPPSP